jgi:hypothetical protein
MHFIFLHSILLPLLIFALECRFRPLFRLLSVESGTQGYYEGDTTQYQNFDQQGKHQLVESIFLYLFMIDVQCLYYCCHPFLYYLGSVSCFS